MRKDKDHTTPTGARPLMSASGCDSCDPRSRGNVSVARGTPPNRADELIPADCASTTQSTNGIIQNLGHAGSPRMEAKVDNIEGYPISTLAGERFTSRPSNVRSSGKRETTPEFTDSSSSAIQSFSVDNNSGSTIRSRAELTSGISDYSPATLSSSPSAINIDAMMMEESAGVRLIKTENNVGANNGVVLEKGHVVEISIHGENHSGVVRWLGLLPGQESSGLVAGLEMDVDNELFSDGTYFSKRYFTCSKRRGLFVFADQCKTNPLLYESTTVNSSKCIEGTPEFGDIECPFISGCVHPLNLNASKMPIVCGRNKGIQGHHNSCYLDATLFSMFAFTDVFDCVLFRQKMAGDIAEYENVQTVLHQAIVNPLRTNMYVRADNVLKLRYMLDKLGTVTGLTCEEKDPEEFLNSLLQQIMKAKPFLKLSSGQESFYYQLFVEKKEQITFPTVQYLVQQSFYSSNVKLRQEPSCLIILMPRFGKQYKVYPRIFPTLDLDVSEIIENAHRSCCSCGKLSEYECMDCFQESEQNDLHCAFCDGCLKRFHGHDDRKRHRSRKLILKPEHYLMKDLPVVKPIEMKLFAVVCIETSHYVAFVRCGRLPDSPWCFFDSMADRKGGQNGFNIPEVVECENLNFWLSSEGYNELQSTNVQPPDYVKRLVSDAYLCMYYSPTVSMYA